MAKKWIEIMLRSSLCDYSDVYVLIKRTKTVANTTAQGQESIGADKKLISKNCAPFPNRISRINNTQVDNASYIDVVTPMFNLI